MLTLIRAVFVFAVLPGWLFGQKAAADAEGTIRISRQVVDVLKLPLPGTTGTLTGSAAAKLTRTALTGREGRFAFSAVPREPLQLRFDVPGFPSSSRQLAVPAVLHDIDVGQVLLEIGEVTEGPVIPPPARPRVKPVTVCEVLAHPKRLNGKPIALLGRLECGGSLIDRVCFLTEDQCDHPVTTEGFVWPNRVLIESGWEPGMPKPPAHTPEIDPDVLAQKMSALHRSTRPSVHKEPRFKTQGSTITFSHMADVNDEWGVAYGLLFAAPKLRSENCGDALGCGGFDGAPVVLIVTPDNLRSLNATAQ